MQRSETICTSNFQACHEQQQQQQQQEHQKQLQEQQREAAVAQLARALSGAG